MAGELDSAMVPQAEACMRWVTDTAGMLATDVARAPAVADELLSALIAISSASLCLGVALAQQDRAWALAAVQQFTTLQALARAEEQPPTLPPERQRTVYLDIARRLIAQAPLAAAGDADPV